MEKKELTYNEAVIELEAILKDLENSSEVNMDKIAAQVKRAGELMDFCKKQLHDLDTSLSKMLEELN